MKVKELISLLLEEDQEAQVEVYGYDGRGEVTGVEATFYNNPKNIWVGIRNGLESEPSDYQKALKDSHILRETLNKIRKNVNDAIVAIS